MYPDVNVPAAGRTIHLLELLLQNPQGVTLQECLTTINISRSSFFALLNSLKKLGYVEQAEARGRYRAGVRLRAWKGPSLNLPQDLLTSFYQEATSLDLDETLVLVLPEGESLFVLAQVESPHPVRSAFETGQRLSPTESAAGSILSAPPQKEVRTQGFYLHSTDDTVELALPVCRDGNNPDAVLLLSAPGFRHSTTSLLVYLPKLREAAARLSYRMGAPTYAPYQSPAVPLIGHTQPLNEAEITAFLNGPWTARLACLRPDGTPHLVSVWHEWDGIAFHVAAWKGSRWAEYVETNPSVSFTVDEPWPPLRRVSVRGSAKRLDTGALPGGTSALLNRLYQRYLGTPMPPNLHTQDWHPFRITPESIRGWRGLHMAEK
ncbi:MAG: pyridoxamine 5'-phosphate oxidase family protein [Chloroflexota bacterium]